MVPKNGNTFTSGGIIRIEFPSDNYLNVLNSVLQWDVSVQRAPLLVTGILTSDQLAATVSNTPYSDFILNTDQVVTFTYAQASGTVFTFAAAQGGTSFPTAGTAVESTYDGQILTVHRQGVVYSAVIAHSSVTVKTVSSIVYSNLALFLSTPLACGPVIASDVLAIHYPQTWQRGGPQNAIKRLRVLYGSLVLEDLYEYKTLVRILYECGVPGSYTKSHGQIGDGMFSTGGNDWQPSGRALSAQSLSAIDYKNENLPIGTGTNNTALTAPKFKDILVAQNQVLGKVITPATELAKLDLVPQVLVSTAGVYSGTGVAGSSSFGTSFNFGAKTYCLNLLSGIFTQKKLLPLKWMAAQLVIEITLATPEDSMLSPQSTTTTAMTVNFTNVNFIAEMLEFDSTYDTGLYDGLRAGGIPIKFGTFHYHTFNMTGNNQVIQIHERSRSVKAAFAVIRTTQANSILYDSDRFFEDTGASFGTTYGEIVGPGVGSLDTFQWRVGGRYYPAQPVRCQFGGAEAFLELSKALDNVGDYTRGSQLHARNWTCATGGKGSQFIMACEFENTDVFPDTIAGINAEVSFFNFLL